MENEKLPSACLPKELAQKVYCTQSIIDVMIGLRDDGYSGLGLGLVLDLIERDAHVS
jgi:hypothetical protein